MTVQAFLRRQMIDGQCPDSTRRARPDFVGDPVLGPGSPTKSVRSALVSNKSVDFVWSDPAQSVSV